MGKTHKRENKEKIKGDKYFFNVLVREHGKNPHTETYSIKSDKVASAKKLGFLSEKNQYLDWKPLKEKDFEGGLFNVSKVTRDEKYVYAHINGSKEPSFSLPEYLYKENRYDDVIMVGRRER
jgi:hypothetical protein